MCSVRWPCGLRRDADIPGGGIWDSSSLTWKNESGEVVSWADGNAAAFPQGGSITLAADVQVTTLTVGGSDFVLSGRGVLEVGKVVTSALSAEIACPVYATGDFAIQSGVAQVKGESGVYLSANEWRKIGASLPLASVGGFSMSDHSIGWNAEGSWNGGEWKDNPEPGIQTVDTLAANLSARKLFVVSRAEERMVVEYRRLFESYGVYWLAAMQVELKTEGEALLAKVIGSKTLRVGANSGLAAFDDCSYETLESRGDSEKGGSVWPFLIYDEAPWTSETRPQWKGVNAAGGDWRSSDLVGAIGDFSDFAFMVTPQMRFSGRVLAGGKISVGENLEMTFAGPLSDIGRASESARDYLTGDSFVAALSGDFESAAVQTVLTMGGSQSFGGTIRTVSGGGLTVAAGTEVVLSDAAYASRRENHSAAWHISGTVLCGRRYGFSLDAAAGSLQSEVLDGGRIVFDFENAVGGTQPLFIRKGGTLVLKRRNCLGTDKIVTVEAGGVVENAWIADGSDGTHDTDRQTVRGNPILSGGQFVGTTMWFGYESWGWKPTELSVSGYSASVLSVDRIVIDFPGGMLRGTCTADFAVSDVTRDEASDLLVESPIVRRSDGSEPTDYTRWAYGIRKKGAGTLELRQVCTFGEIDGTAAGQTFLEEGTLRLASSATGSRLGRLQVDGSASLQLDEGVSIAFADSREISGTNPNDNGAAYTWAWATDATLTLKNRLERNAIRFGTDANGLTEAQLAAIRYADGVTTKTPVFTLSESGYLKDGLDGGFFLRIR